MILSTKTVSSIETEIFDACEMTRKTLLRPTADHKMCIPQYKICPYRYRETHVIDERGTKYRLLSFNCKASNAIYVIAPNAKNHMWA